MIDAPLAYAFTAGLVAAVNPCGFPMLPAYLSYFIGLDEDGSGGAGRVVRAITSAGAVALGFLAVFSVLGIPINAGITSIYEVMPWLTIVIGALLGALGAAMLTGWKPVVLLPRLDRGGRSRRFGSMALFGVSYAVASLGCTLPVFLVVVAGTTERANALSGAFAFAAYCIGMTVVLMTVSIALALARDGFVRRLRELSRFVDRASGVLLLAVGAYLIWYGIYAIDPANSTASSPLGWVEQWSSDATAWLSDGGTGRGLALAAFVAAAAAIAIPLSRGRRP
ncbi:MAG TPA: cytochrome c biogenesis CcdA family protein [Acidimicrobiales bacterium]|nr:cytochrome c biogenesis CcdA family protein [Acidimicrobiales bacterium]